MRKLYRRKPQAADLNLNSLMDMFTIILFFFLVNYTEAGVLMKLVENINLPVSESRLPVAEKYFIGVLADKIVIEDIEYRNTGADDDRILAALRSIRGKGGNYLVIQADKELPFFLVRNYIRLAVQAGFAKPFLAVIPQ